MNIENLNKAIAVMTRAGRIEMDSWQSDINSDGGKVKKNGLKKTEEEIHSCGTTACFAGWIGVSPEWAKDGGSITRSGEPFLDNGDIALESDAKLSLATWFDLPPEFIEMLMFSEDGSIYKQDPANYDDDAPSVYSIYSVPFNAITSVDIVNTLIRIRDLGFVEFLKEEITKLEALTIAPLNGYEINLIERFEDFIAAAKVA